MFETKTTRKYVKWCPRCDVWCDFERVDFAEALAENHDKNFHNGDSVSLVLNTEYATTTEDT